MKRKNKFNQEQSPSVLQFNDEQQQQMPGNALGVFDGGTTRTVYNNSGGTLARGLRVKFGASLGSAVPTVTVADETLAGDGTLEEDIANLSYGNIRLFNNGMNEFAVSGAHVIADADPIYPAPAGQVDNVIYPSTGVGKIGHFGSGSTATAGALVRGSVGVVTPLAS